LSLNLHNASHSSECASSPSPPAAPSVPPPRPSRQNHHNAHASTIIATSIVRALIPCGTKGSSNLFCSFELWRLGQNLLAQCPLYRSLVAHWMANMCRQDKAHTYPLIIQQKAKPKIHNRTKPRLAKYGEETQRRKTEQENCTLMGSVSLLFYFIFSSSYYLSCLLYLMIYSGMVSNK
jgi:hypothetical protein